MIPSAVIFDVDGVLADTEPTSLRTARDAFLKIHGVAVNEAHALELVGMNSTLFFGELEKRYNVESTTAQLITTHNQLLMKELAHAHSIGFPGARELIGSLHDESDLRLALATSSNRRRSEATLRAADISTTPFSLWITGDDITHPKPDPEMFLQAAKRLDVAPARCVVIEDSVMGVAAAKAAGMPCIAVCHTFERPRLSEATVIVDKIAQVDLALVRDLLKEKKYPG